MKVLVVDDEPLARERLQRLLGRLEPDAQCLQAGSGEAALDIVAREAPDLMLLDVRMPGMDGVEVAARLGEIAEPPAVIFCTAYDEHALDAIKHHASAYLLKPVREAELATALENAGRVNRVQMAAIQGEDAAEEGQRTRISSQSHRGIASIAVDEVRCFVAQDKYVTAYSTEDSLLIQDSLKDLEQELGERFLRIHRNALVALAHIVALQRGAGGGWVVELDGLELRPQVSRRHLKTVRERLLAR